MHSIIKIIKSFFYTLFNYKKDLTYLKKYYKIITQKRLVVFDTETTGLDAKNDDIIQIAALEIINGKIGKSFEWYFDTDKSLGSAIKVHNISKEILKSKSIDKKTGLTEFVQFLSVDALLAHNIQFDYSILNNNLLRLGLKMIEDNDRLFCSLAITRQLYKLQSYKLGDILNSLNIEGKNSHNAKDDVEATANLALKLKNRIKKMNLVD